MKNQWEKVFNRWTEDRFPSYRGNIISSAKKNQEEISSCLKDFDYPEIDELYKFYSYRNGVGLREPKNTAEIWWFFSPIERLQEFREICINHFKDTHPFLAERYFPFYDALNGDSMGYMLNKDGECCSGIYYFDHEIYYGEEFENTDFLDFYEVSLRAFFS